MCNATLCSLAVFSPVDGSRTGAYELVAKDIHDAKGELRTEIQKGEYFALKTEKIVRRGDRIFLLKVEE